MSEQTQTEKKRYYEPAPQDIDPSQNNGQIVPLKLT